MFYYVVVTLYVLVCFLLLTAILLQQGRAGDIASAFGGSSSQTVFGARSGATMLTRATTVLAVIFILGSIGLSIVWQKSPSSVVSGVRTPAAPTAPATPAAPAKK
jgi:preprotein translocase subunit SecG